MTEENDHGPIEQQFSGMMNVIATVLDETFNGPDCKAEDRKVAFTLLVANFGQIDNGRVNYISNGNRSDIIAMMKEITARFEAQAEKPGGEDSL